MSKSKEELSRIRAAVGRLGGLRTTEAKLNAARENIKKAHGIFTEACYEQRLQANAARPRPYARKPKPPRNPRTGKVKYDFWY